MLATLVVLAPLTVVVDLLFAVYHAGDGTVFEQRLGQSNATGADHEGVGSFACLGIFYHRTQRQCLTIHSHIDNKCVTIHASLDLFLADGGFLADTVVLYLGSNLAAALRPISKAIDTLQGIGQTMLHGQK